MRLSSNFSNLIRRHLVQKIRFGGPITVNEYMRTVLTAPTGFYMKQDVFGKHGHFITSPEISQIFGELIAVWILHEWQRFGLSEPLHIVEMGPGRGSLMSDITRVLSRFKKTDQQVFLHLVEISPYLASMQETVLCNTKSEWKENYSQFKAKTVSGYPIVWYQNLMNVPVEKGFTCYIANEFLDALPIHKFQKDSDNQWKELLIDVNDENELKFIISRHQTPACKSLLSPEFDNLYHLELCPAGSNLIENIADRINQSPGCCLICDYGFDCNDKISRDTFRAFRNNSPWDPLKDPGEADLTADVDFCYLKKLISSKSVFFGPTSQASFLNNMGAGIRIAHLIEKVDENQKQHLIKSFSLLFDEMGKRFKFFSFFPASSRHLFPYRPPGFLPICKTS